jgi:hypothetical protein
MRLPESELTYERVVAECRQQLAASGFVDFSQLDNDPEWWQTTAACTSELTQIVDGGWW